MDQAKKKVSWCLSYRVLLGFPEIYYWILLGSIIMNRIFTVFYLVLLVDSVLLDNTGFYWVLSSLTRFDRGLLGFTGFYWVLLGFTEIYWV